MYHYELKPGQPKDRPKIITAEDFAKLPVEEALRYWRIPIN